MQSSLLFIFCVLLPLIVSNNAIRQITLSAYKSKESHPRQPLIIENDLFSDSDGAEQPKLFSTVPHTQNDRVESKVNVIVRFVWTVQENKKYDFESIKTLVQKIYLRNFMFTDHFVKFVQFDIISVLYRRHCHIFSTRSYTVQFCIYKSRFRTNYSQ